MKVMTWALMALGTLLAWVGGYGMGRRDVHRAPTPVSTVWFDTLSLSAQRDSIVAQAARDAGVPVALALAVSHTENWSGDSAAVSSAGAIGLMQVMPKKWQHSFEAECGCGDLLDRRRNACKGVHVLKVYLDSLPTTDQALRAYHGSSKLPTLGNRYVTDVFNRMVRIPDRWAMQ